MRRVTKVLTTFVVLFLAAATIYGAITWRYWRNFIAMTSDLDRVAYADKYSPTQAITAPIVRDFPATRDAGRTISAEALDDAAAYAKAAGTMAFLVVHRGIMQREDYAPGYGPNSLFDSYSMHKGLVSLAVGVAIDKGLIRSIDEPASIYLPEWRGDDRKRITLRSMLWMNSGLFYPAYAKAPFNPVLDFFIGTDIRPVAFSVPLAHTPGEVFEFNHINTQNLSFVIEAAAKMSYGEFLSRTIWTPLGAQTAYVALDHEGGAARAVCCLISTARNWVRVGEMMRNKGRVGDVQVVSEGWIDLMITPNPDTNPNFGFSVWTASPFSGGRLASGVKKIVTKVSRPYDAPDLYFMEGHGGQRLYVVPSRELVVYRTGRVTDDWDDPVFMNKILKGTPSVPATQ